MLHKIKESLQPILIVSGFLYTAISFVSTFYNLPFAIDDWRVAFGIGWIIFVGATVWYIYDLHQNYVVSSKPKVILVPNEEEEQDKFYVSKHAYLYIFNNEKRPITDCYAIIEYAELRQDNRESNFVERDYLKWAEKYAVSEHIDIPPKRQVRLDVADTLTRGRTRFSTRSSDCSGPHGLYSKIRIEIDGNFNGKPMKTQVFDGYLYVEVMQPEIKLNATTTVTKVVAGKKNTEERKMHSSLEYIYMIFDKGEWSKDFRVPVRRNVNLN